MHRRKPRDNRSVAGKNDQHPDLIRTFFWCHSPVCLSSFACFSFFGPGFSSPHPGAPYRILIREDLARVFAARACAGPDRSVVSFFPASSQE
ncbi:hypothetical protein Mboo_0441 [Methanoregula boonei 6A8]|uniref:Uncharacterized protein n=1 Tax=Methanoregula boonei (strain DSM 21154 / JCM 14090 / 6A8) TaxID=456442 RepID=A7I5E9_METB6|nr:hypothetical protein Mboo_0441 [Methanoregula boonei 6A8]